MRDATRVPCRCLDPECASDAFHETDLGVDHSDRGVAIVSLFDCRFCSHRWLHYAQGKETWTQAKRWYRGPISTYQSKLVTPDNALSLLASLPWYFFGGEDFDSEAMKGSGPIPEETECGGLH